MRLNGLDIGSLDKLFTIEYPTYAANATTNEQVRTWATYTTVWGKWMGTSEEKIEASQAVAVNLSKMMIRWTNGLTEVMRVKDGTTYYYIRGIDNSDRLVSMTLKLERRDNV